MAYKLIALDMDGTVLTSDKRITAATQEAVAQASARGFEVALCTGRSYSELREALEAMPSIRYAVCCNGASVVDGATLAQLYSNPLPLSLAQQVYGILSHFDMQFEVFAGTKVYTQRHCCANPAHYGVGPLLPLITETRLPVDNMTEFLATLTIPVNKINIFFPTASMRDDAWREAAVCPVSLTTSEPTNLEVNLPSADKGDGLAHLAAHLGLRREEVVAIGDNLNDLQMLEYAGLAVAMGNAVEQAKLRADSITDTNDNDGVAKAIHSLWAD